MSIAGGPANALLRGHSIGCDTIQIFTKSPNQWRAKPLTEDQLSIYKDALRETGVQPVVAHSSYLINLGSPDDELWNKSVDALTSELGRCHQLGIDDYVLHPGAHVGSGVAAGLWRVALGLNTALSRTAHMRVRVLLETSAGQGTSLGSDFEQLAFVLEHSEPTDRLGVCFDTAHAWAAGYTFADPESYAEMWRGFDRIIGICRLYVIHLNDSKRDLGSRVDRHEQIGEGYVGLDAFRLLVNDAALVHLPMILETPKDVDLSQDVANLALLRGLTETNRID